MLVVCDAVLLQCFQRSIVRVIADMVCACATAIEFGHQAFVGRFGGEVLENALSHCRTTNISEAHKEHGYWFGHLGNRSRICVVRSTGKRELQSRKQSIEHNLNEKFEAGIGGGDGRRLQAGTP